MGNNQSSGCCSNHYLNDIDNSVEATIRENIETNSGNLKTYSEIKAVAIKLFQINLIDIDNIPLEWIKKETYGTFILSIFKTTANKNHQLHYLDIALNYNDVNVSNQKYKVKFNLLLLIWLLYLTKLDRKDKIQIIKEIIIKVNKIVTFSSFCAFLKTYLEISLNEITLNFLANYNASVESNQLVNQIFNIQNLEDYYDWLCKKMKFILEKEYEDENEFMGKSNLNIVFIRDEHLMMFFEENKFLLKTLELRVNFYDKYSPAISHLPSVG